MDDTTQLIGGNLSETQVIPAQRPAGLREDAVHVPPRVPQPPPVPYRPPSPAYLARLIDRAREAAGKASAASDAYNDAAARAEAVAALSERRGSEHQRVAVRFARKGVPEVVDADNQYKFWSGEQQRLCAMIAAEHALWEMMNRG